MNTKSKLKHEPSSIIKEIARRRLIDSIIIKKTKKIRELCSHHPKTVTLVKPPPLQKPTSRYRRDINLEKYNIDNLKNPYSIPDKDRITKNNTKERKRKPTTITEDKIVTIKDVFGEVYFEIEGRPIRTLNDINVYMKNVTGIMQTKMDIGYLKEDMLNLEIFHGIDEVITYKEIRKLAKETQKNFQLFLHDIHRMTDNCTKRQMAKEAEIASAQEELEKWNYEHFLLRTRLTILSDRFSVLSVYKRFLDNASPLWWRLQNRVGFLCHSTRFKNIFIDSSDEDSLEDKPPLTLVSQKPIKLYFQTPEDMMNILDDERIYGLRYLQIYMFNEIGKNKVLNERDDLKKHMEVENIKLQYEVETYEKDIIILEENAKLFEGKFYKILNGYFKKAIISEGALKLSLCVEYLHEKIFGLHFTEYTPMSVLMNEIETKYMEYRLLLDQLDYETTEEITRKLMLIDRIMMKRALNARKKLREHETFRKSLQKCFERPKHSLKFT